MECPIGGDTVTLLKSLSLKLLFFKCPHLSYLSKQKKHRWLWWDQAEAQCFGTVIYVWTPNSCKWEGGITSQNHWKANWRKLSMYDWLITSRSKCQCSHFLLWPLSITNWRKSNFQSPQRIQLAVNKNQHSSWSKAVRFLWWQNCKLIN